MFDLQNPIFVRVLPFALYMSFIAVVEGAKLLGMPAPSQETMNWLYPLKAGVVTAALIYCWKSYDDLDWESLKDFKNTALSIGMGVVVFILWINLDMEFAVQGELTAFDPATFGEGTTRLFMITSRVLGAALVVPIMEELFWKSFLARYLIHKDFLDVAPGTFTAFTFIGTAVLFGLEHQLWLAGVVAGLAYNFLYYQTKSLAQCILSHGITNAILAGYVLISGNWHFW